MMTPSLVPKPWGEKPLCAEVFGSLSPPALSALSSQKLQPPLCPPLLGPLLEGWY